MSDVLRPDWPAPAHIHAFTTTRLGPGVSELPFYRFNLGARCGDKPADVNANREALRRAHPDHGGDERAASKAIADLGEARKILTP